MIRAHINRTVPDFIAAATSNERIQLSTLKPKRTLLFFYPKDNTPSCTIENQDFSANYERFKTRNTVVIGISRDSMESHEKFKRDLNIPFELISDSNEALCQLFNVVTPKEMFGHTISSLARSTFLINEDGVLIYEWRDISIKEHVHQILSVLDQFDALELKEAK